MCAQPKSYARSLRVKLTLARALNVSASTIQAWEAGRRPRGDVGLKLLAITEKHSEALVTRFFWAVAGLGLEAATQFAIFVRVSICNGQIRSVVRHS